MNGAVENHPVEDALIGLARSLGLRATPVDRIVPSTMMTAIERFVCGAREPWSSERARVQFVPVKSPWAESHVAGLPSKPNTIELTRWSLATTSLAGTPTPVHIQTAASPFVSPSWNPPRSAGGG